MRQPIDDFEPVFNRVPRVTVSFWIIKLLAVTVGETAADYLALNLGYGLSTTTWFMSAILGVVLIIQFAQKRYVPWAYWLRLLRSGQPRVHSSRAPALLLEVAIKIVEHGLAARDPLLVVGSGHADAGNQRLDTGRFLACELAVLEINVMDDL